MIISLTLAPAPLNRDDFAAETIQAVTVPSTIFLLALDCLVGQVVKASASKMEDPGFDSRLRRGGFSGWSHTRYLIKH